MEEAERERDSFVFVLFCCLFFLPIFSDSFLFFLLLGFFSMGRIGPPIKKC